jgi:UDP-N-acetylglucosamine--N-acetylmuramyl-(pentapeptide) pyrophosphoryl-undecaprenol N-acetylglucosamine transferase
VIFATVGSHPTFGFDRLLRALEAVDLTELVVQFGPGKPPAGARRAVAWMTFEEIVDHMSRASHVVSHAGVGTVLCAIQAGHVPIVFPRLQRFGETVDDHQREFARAIERTKQAIVVEDAEQLSSALQSSPPRGVASHPGGMALIEAVAGELAQASSR